jgi:hypothetical protein
MRFNGTTKNGSKSRWKPSDKTLGIPLFGSRGELSTSEPTKNDEPTDHGHKQMHKSRRALIGGALAGLFASSLSVKADDDRSVPGNPFILLLHGLYQPVPAAQAPNLGLSTVNLNDGTYSKTKIYPVFRAPGATGENLDDAIGTFYVSLATFLCAYDLPGGTIAMQFLPSSAGFTLLIPDGTGGQFDEGTFELTILEATGIYKAFKGGHNHMVDRLHQLKAGAPFAGFPSSGYDEFCFCFISQYQFP